MTREKKQPTGVTVVGLLGGVASGKSVVARRFGELGAEIIEGDALGHLVLGEPEVIELLRNRWGPAVVDDLGQIRRRAVAERVFDDPAELAFLEGVTHPRIGHRIEERIDSLRVKCQHSQTPRIVVLDAAVMLKAGWDAYCDRIVFVDSPQQIRKNRAIQRGWTSQHFEMREAAQVPIQEKRRRGDIVIDNGGCLEQTYEQVLNAWKSLSH